MHGRSRLALIASVQNPLHAREKGVNGSWRGAIQAPSGPAIPAIIKDLDARQLANELMAHALCRTVGLPIPEAYIVIDDGTIPEAVKGPAAPAELCSSLGIGEGRLMFASATCGNAFATVFKMPRRGDMPDSLFDRVRRDAIGAMRRRLVEWPALGMAAAFDEWAAVIDRHEGNLLLDGNGGVWLIDHGHAFTGARWAPADLRQLSFGNCLVAEAVRGMAREQLLGQVMHGASILDAKLAANDNALAGAEAAIRGLGLIPEEDFRALGAFLAERRSRVRGFLEHSVGEALKGVAGG